MSSLPGKHDLTIYRGDEYIFTIKLVDVDELPIDITNPMFAQWRRLKTAIDFIELTVVPGDTSGSFIIHITGEQSRDMTENGVWDLEERPITGDPRTLLAGTVKVIDDVTRLEIL